MLRAVEKAGDPIQYCNDIEGIGFPRSDSTYREQIWNRRSKRIKTEHQSGSKLRVSVKYLYRFGICRDFLVNKKPSIEEGQINRVSYFKERGFSPAIREKFGILGYALDGWDHFLKAAKSVGFQEDILLKSWSWSSEGKMMPPELLDRFRGTVLTFTISQCRWKTIDFGARILTKDKNQPENTFNLPETPVYSQSWLCSTGMFQAKKAIRDKDNCFFSRRRFTPDVVSIAFVRDRKLVVLRNFIDRRGQIQAHSRRFTNQSYASFMMGIAAGIQSVTPWNRPLLEGGLNVKAVVFPGRWKIG